MAQQQYIKDLYENEEVSLREIARRTKLSFQTVQKYAYKEDWSEERIPNLEAENYPSLKEYIPTIDEWMEADRKVPRKQRHTAMRIYHRLEEELGYGGSYSSVRRYVSKGTERVLTDGFRRFMLHYRFQADFCNPASGNEKGNVENKVGYSRRNAFVPVPTITSFEEFNQWLWEWCEQDAQRLHYKYKIPIQELWETDEKSLLNLPEHPFPVFRYEAVTVNKYGFATLDTNKYGLAPALSGRIVQAKLFFDHVEFYYDHKPVGRYKRSYEREQELCDWTQYVGTFLKKPGAVEHTRFFRQMPRLWQDLLRQSKGRERKDALRLLDEIVRDGNAGLCEDALSLAAENGRTDPDSIRQCYYMIAKKEFRPEPLLLKTPTPQLHYDPKLTAYDGLTGGVSHA